MPGVLLDGEGHAVVIGDSLVLQEVDTSDPRIRRGCRKRTKTEAVHVIVKDKAVVTTISDVVRRNHSALPKGVLNLNVPLHIFGVLEISAHVVQGRHSLISKGIDATRRRRCVGVQTAATGKVACKRRVARLNKRDAASGERGRCRGVQIECDSSRRHIPQVYLREVCVKATENRPGIQITKEPDASANYSVLTYGRPSQPEPRFENDFFHARDNRGSSGLERSTGSRIVWNIRAVWQRIEG